MRPMLATRGGDVPTGAEWTHEVKWDGIRLLADVTPAGARLWTRNENDATPAWPELAGAAPDRDLLVDGEVVTFNTDGVPDFGLLQERMHVRSVATAAARARQRPAAYLVFDLLRLDGRDLLDLPLEQRRARLEGLGDDLPVGTWQVPASYPDGPHLQQATLERGLEGVVSKRLGSRYEPGVRSRHWLKFPHRRRGSYVIGGWRPETGSVPGTGRVGSLLVGEPTADGLAYRGRVGSGITGQHAALLRELLAPLHRDQPPFADAVPRPDGLGAVWVAPRLVVDVEALGLSSQQRLRQPSYQGMRPDLTPEDLVAGDRS